MSKKGMVIGPAPKAFDIKLSPDVSEFLEQRKRQFDELAAYAESKEGKRSMDEFFRGVQETSRRIREKHEGIRKKINEATNDQTWPREDNEQSP